MALKTFNGKAVAGIKTFLGKAIAGVYAVDWVTLNSVFATRDPANKNANIVLSWWNLIATNPAGTTGSVKSTLFKGGGKRYWECTINSQGSLVVVGIGKSTATLANYPWSDANGYGYLYSNGKKITGNSQVTYGAAYTTWDIISVALDLTVWEVTFYKNWVSQWVAYTWITWSFYAMSGVRGGAIVTVNFGATAFAYTPPAGFNPWLYT